MKGRNHENSEADNNEEGSEESENNNEDSNLDFSDSEEFSDSEDYIEGDKNEISSIEKSEPCSYVHSRRSSDNTENKEDKIRKKIKKVKIEKKQKVIINPEIVKKPIGTKCCNENCLNKLDYDDFERIYVEWNMETNSSKEKFRKLKEFLRAKLQVKREDAINCHVIQGNYYQLTLEVNNKHFRFCPTAFKKVIHVGNDVLIASVSDNTTKLKLISITKKTKKEEARDWVNSTIVPNCVTDEHYPGILRYQHTTPIFL